jgi:hypothetical protein
MVAQRYQHIEHELLRQTLEATDTGGLGTTLGDLASSLRDSLPDIQNREITDTLRRLEPDKLTIWKYNGGQLVKFLRGHTDGEFFHTGSFYLQRTPHTDPYLRDLSGKMQKEEKAMNDEARKARFGQWEKDGLDRIKSDLEQTGGIRVVGGTKEVTDLAWEWVQMKEREVELATKQSVPAPTLTLVSETRLAGLRALSSTKFDFQKLIRFCEELNTCYSNGCLLATAVLTRALLDHVPPIFGQSTFAQVVGGYGSKTFKESMLHLEDGARNVADEHLHRTIRKRETLPTPQQVHFAPMLDVLLAEIIRMTP